MRKPVCQRVYENLSTAVVLTGTDLRILDINPAAEMLFGLSRRQTTGLALSELLPRNQALVEATHAALASGHPFTEHGLRLLLAPGRRVTVDCSVSPLAQEGEEAALLEFNPIDRLLRLAREETSLDQHAASRALMRGLAHEIKNPLGGLRGAAQLLDRELPERQLREYTRIIIHEADRLRNLVDRMVGPNRALERQPVNIHHVLEHVRQLILAETPVGVLIVRDYDPSLPDVQGDADQLIQAVLNIVRNAVQAMQSKGTIRLRTRIERQFTINQQRFRHVLRVDIEDNGPGIPDDIAPHIFYPMVTGRPDGTGLGLSIAQDIIHQHGGLVEVTSRPQHTVFRLYLPLEN